MEDIINLPAGIPYAADQWSEPVNGFQFRVWPSGPLGIRLWRKENGRHFFGGYQIVHCHLSSRIASEWLTGYCKARSEPIPML
jgi:hypothetical protein